MSPPVIASGSLFFLAPRVPRSVFLVRRRFVESAGSPAGSSHGDLCGTSRAVPSFPTGQSKGPDTDHGQAFLAHHSPTPTPARNPTRIHHHACPFGLPARLGGDLRTAG